MVTTNGGPLRAPDTTVVFTPSTITIAVGETVTINYSSGMATPSANTLDALFGGIATTEVAGSVTGTVTITGVSVGTATIAPSTSLGNGATMGYDGFSLTVTAPADDQNFLNERGLAHFWENVDDIKQDKLTAGAGISITGNTISATGGGTADAVDWGNITGSMSNQTDLMTALNAKANTADLATVATSGDYDDLTDKPTIGNATLTIQKNGTSAGTFTANATSNKAINITVPTTAADVSALPASTKYGASIAVSINTADYRVTTTLKDQDGNTLGTAQVIDLPLESVVVNGSYDNTNKKIVLTLQNGSTIDIPVADLVAGLQSEITSTNKLSSDLVDDTNHTHKFVTAAQITKLNGIAAGAEVNVQSDWTESDSSSDAYIQNKPSLATVATSGSYNDLSNKPTIPTVNNATLTIQKNGTTVNTFTANASSDVTANITVPINVSELTNDAGYITSYTDNKTAQTLTRPTTSTTYYPVASASLSTNTADVKKFSGVSLSYFDNEGGAAALTLGYASLNGSVAGLISLVDSVGALGRTVIAGSGKSSTGNHTLNTPDTSGRLVANSSSDSATGSATNPVYADSDGVLHATTYTLEKSVPSNAVFTDTTYSDATTSAAGLMSAADKTKLNGIATGAEVNVQSDWNVTNAASDAFIKNKPTLATVATSGSYDDLSDKPTIPAAQVQSNWAQTTTTAVDYIKNKPALSTVATSGSYNDLSDKPTIPAAQVNSDWNASSGVAQILNKPTIPTVNDATLTIQQNGADVQTFTANQSTNATANITVPTATSDLTNDGADGSSTYVEADELATVATTGNYSDLSGTPTIPTVNDATLTIKQNNTTLGTFTANASTSSTITVNAPNYYNLYGQVQTSTYRRSVIALCEVSTANSTSLHSWFSGHILFHRDNGLAGVEDIYINMENQYYSAYYTNVSFISNIPKLASNAALDSAIGWRPCTFKYDNKYYGGIEVCTNIANHNIVVAVGTGNFSLFGVDYYSMAHDSTASSVLNSEIYNSLNYTQWSEKYNQWHVGRATRDIIYDNASGVNGNFSTTTAMSSYDEVEICYRDGNHNYALKRIPGAAGNFALDIAHPGGSSTVQWYVSRWSVSGVNATASATCMRKAIASTSVSTYAEKDIYITRITGIRY